MPAQTPPALSMAGESTSTMIMSTPAAMPSSRTPSTVTSNASGSVPSETVQPVAWKLVGPSDCWITPSIGIVTVGPTAGGADTAAGANAPNNSNPSTALN